MGAETPPASRGAVAGGLLVLIVAGAGLFGHPRDTSIGDRELAIHLEAARTDAARSEFVSDALRGPERTTRAPLGTLLLSLAYRMGAPQDLVTARRFAAGLGIIAVVALLIILGRLHGAAVAAAATCIALLHPAVLESSRGGGRGAAALLLPLIAGLVGLSKPPTLARRTRQVLLLALAGLAAGPVGIALSWVVRAAACRERREGWRWILVASVLALLPWILWFLAIVPLASGLSGLPLTAFFPVPEAAPDAWPLLSRGTFLALQILALVGVLRGVGDSSRRELLVLVIATALPLLLPLLRAPWALSLLLLPAALALGRRLPELAPPTRRLVDAAALALLGFVAGRTLADVCWLQGSAYYTNSALILAAASVIAVGFRRSWSPLPAALGALVAVVVLTGFTLALHPRDPSALQVGPMLRRAEARGEALHDLDRFVPELQFGARRRRRPLGEAGRVRARRHQASTPIWVVTHPEGDAAIDALVPPSDRGPSFTLESLGRRLVLRRL